MDPAIHGTRSKLACVVRAQWNGPFFSEIEQFPREKDDQGAKINNDQVDAMSRAFFEASKTRGSAGAQKWAENMRALRA
jgi:phage terminase large subunit-like protein